MGSPFANAQDYINATGLVDSFAGHPVAATVCLILSVVVTVYFLYKTFTIHADSESEE